MGSRSTQVAVLTRILSSPVRRHPYPVAHAAPSQRNSHGRECLRTGRGLLRPCSLSGMLRGRWLAQSATPKAVVLPIVGCRFRRSLRLRGLLAMSLRG
eukprot:3652746-Pyramimonas_sp.AAC.1